MKKRNRFHRGQSNRNSGGWFDLLARRKTRNRRTWSFERLEERYYLTAAPATGLEGLSWYTVSNSTAEGQQLVDALSQLWALQASANDPAGSNMTVRAAPTDPGFQFQWHLFNVGQIVNPGQFQDLRGLPGQDINVLPVWDSGITGAGVNVAVVDTGVELSHPDLAANINTQWAFSAITGNVDANPQGSAAAAHGTAVAGLIAADNNGQGGVGVAHGATIVPIRLIATNTTGLPELPGAFEDAFIRAVGANGNPIDVFNHSWGPEDVVEVDGVIVGNRGVNALSMQQLIALTNSARSARNGLGAIHVFAAGNGALAWDSAGSDGYVNSRYTIGVGIVDHDGQFLNSDNTTTGYGEMAPSVLIVAPSGSGPIDIIHNFATGSGIFTTDLTNGGINVPPLPSGIELDNDPYLDDDYTFRFGGTSAAAPLVSGVIALMLEANPNLSYRDVEEILVRSARQNDDLDPSWIVNNIGIFRDPIAPDPSQDPINDGIEFIIVPGMITAEAVQAKTPQLTSTTGAMFSIHAVEGGSFDGEAGNAISVDFNSVAGPNGVLAQLQGDVIVVTVSGTPTWGAIQNAIAAIGGGGSFELVFADGADANLLFSPADGALMGQLAGGANAEGEEPTAGNADPFYNPIFNPRTQPLPVGLATNGAGFTVSHGRRRGDSTEYGYAHGVVDAALAVELARQWHLKDQNLPPEKTWISSQVGSVTIRAAQVSNEESGEFLVPGGLSNATEGFIEFFNEFFKEPTVEAGDPEGDPPTMDMIDPDSLPFAGDDPPVNTRGAFVPIDIPAIDPVTGGSNLMSIEWVEVQLNVTGDSDAMNYLRITLVSPDGTHSELTQNHFRPGDIDKSFQQGTLPVGLFVGFGDSITPEDENGTNSGELDWVYSTNRHWGERSDSNFSGNGSSSGLWELHFENYSGSDLELNGVAVAFHGTPVGSPAGPVERVTGKVGVDGGRFIQLTNQIVGAQDQLFNFDRVVPNSSPADFLLFPSGFRTDPFQEDFAGNVTVYAIDNSTGQRVAEFLTGADGNYYFDLPAGEYTIGVEDSLGRTALGNGPNFDDEWVIQVDITDADPRSAASNVNFLLDPGSLPPSEVVYTGRVVGDLDADGALDPADIGVFNFTVYADLNHTGQFEIGEPFALTNQDGTYTLNVPTATPNTFTIGVKPPTGWAPTNPVSGFHNDYSQPGETVPLPDFMFTPPTSPSGEGPGTLFGLIFSDKDGDGVQDQNEVGLAGRTVFIDTNENGMLDDGESSVVTNANGAYQFGEVPLGSFRLDVVINEPFKLTSPIKVPLTGEGWIDVTLVAGQVIKGLNFGVQNQAINDYGDLVGAGFATGSASSLVAVGVHLGSGVDTEIRPKNLIPQGGGYVEDANLHGIGDDQNQNESSFDDEDGVVLVGEVLRPGSNLFQITVSGVGFYLQGWIDFNDNGTFESSEQVFTNLDINPGTHQLVVNAPTSLVAGDVAARFRWGTINQTYSGADTFGEIEDYLFETAVPALGDYNADGNIDQDDYKVWKSTFGSTADLRADGNKNGIIDIGDYTVWRNIKDGGGGGAAAVAMAPPLQQQSLTTLTLSEPIEPPAPQTVLQLIGEQPLPSGVASGYVSQQPESGGAGSVLVGTSVVESGGKVVATRFDATVPLTSVFTASILPTDVAGAKPQAGFSGESADLAMLLLATGYFQGQQLSSDDDADATDAAWLDEGKRDGDLDLAFAAVFEDERDWRYAL